MDLLDVYRRKIIDLNNVNNLTPGLLHRNKPMFKLVSYINLAFTFLMSESYDYCALFINRAEYEYGNAFNKSNNYIIDSMVLLKEIKNALVEYNLLSDNMTRIINE